MFSCPRCSWLLSCHLSGLLYWGKIGDNGKEHGDYYKVRGCGGLGGLGFRGFRGFRV